MEEVDLRFSLKDICALTGVSHQSIRMYEKWGVLPKVTEEGNGYRYYHYPDLQRAMFLRRYASLGIPIKSVAALINGARIEDIERSYETYEEQLESRVRFAEAALGSIRLQKEMLREISAYEPVCTVATRPGMYRLPCGKNGVIFSAEKTVEQMQLWNSLQPVAMFSGLSSAEDMRPDSIVDPGFAILEEYADILPDKNAPGIRYYPPVRCIKTALRISSDAKDFRSMGMHQDVYMQEHGYRAKGEIISLSVANKLLTDRYPDDPSDYVCCWTEFEETR